ncbi:MAG: amidohydrolase family protein, partial [Planctomycetes bacterium]|nr:amidohydrolase family protein [Planctomycetota bacterium]
MTSPCIIDAHIHIAGTSAGGCWFHPRRLRAPGFRIMLRSLGIESAKIANHLDQALEERLAQAVEESPLEQAVVLAFDWARDGNGEPIKELSDFYVPNDYVFQLARKYPKFLPGASIHPFREDALEELHRCAKAGAVLVKWLPASQNFSPGDPRCTEFFEALQRLRMPLLCHTGSEGATRNLNKAWNDPRLLRRALEAGGTVIAAHCGMRSAPHDR